MTKGDHVDRLIAKWGKERPDYDLAPVHIIGRVGRICEYIDRALEAKFAEFDITRASFDVLATLKRTGPPYRLSQRELMNSLMRTSGSISVRIDAMERQGLVTREPDAEDRRTSLVALTKKGMDLLDKIVPEHLSNEESLLAGLSAQERRVLTRLLRKWNLALESSNDPRYVNYGMMILDARATLQCRRAVGLPDVPGVLVNAVETGGVAEQAGIRKGDLITALEDVVVDSQPTLRRELNKPNPRKKRLKIVRGAEALEIDLFIR
jgi:DNA-binding MarR family transcriptional regulator